MKDLKTILEGNFTGPGTFGDIDTPNKRREFGFMTYDDNSGTMAGVQADDAEQLAKAFSTDDVDIYEDLFNIEVSESIDLKDQGIWCRIW